jgi:hypothetical protein
MVGDGVGLMAGLLSAERQTATDGIALSLICINCGDAQGESGNGRRSMTSGFSPLLFQVFFRARITTIARCPSCPIHPAGKYSSSFFSVFSSQPF